MTNQDKLNGEFFSDLDAIRQELYFLIKSAEQLNAEPIEKKIEFIDPEDQLRKVLEIAADGIWDWNIRINRVVYSRRWKEILGYNETGIGDSLEEWSERIHKRDLKTTLSLLINHLKGETQFFASEYRINCKDGSYKWILSEGKVVVRDNLGNAVRFVVNNKDISLQKNTEFELRERLKELNCHNQMSKIIGNSALTADEVISQIVQTIPGSWQFPEIAQAAALINNKVYRTQRYTKSELTLIQEVKVSGQVVGQVEVGYPQDETFETDQIFLPEESLLLFSISNRIGSFIEKNERGIALNESQLKYRNIIENINDVIFEIDIQGIITFISSSVEKIFGYNAEELIGKDFKDFVGSYSQYLSERLNELREQVELKNEYQIVTKTGESKWIKISTRAKFVDGSFDGATGTMADITDRKNTEVELQKSEALYRSVLNASPDAIIIANLEGIILYSSPRILDMFRYADTHEIINRSVFDFVDKSDHNRAQCNIEKLFLGTLLGAQEYSAIRSDGSSFYIEVNADVIKDPEGSASSMVLVTRDISDRKHTEIELKKSEENYKYIFENAIEGIYRTSLKGKALMANPALATMLGYSSIAEYLNIANDSVRKTWYNPEKRSDYVSLLEKHNIIQGFECQFKRKDGTPIWVSISAKIVRDENGNTAYIEGFVAEITERKLAEEKIEKLSRLYSVISRVSQAIVHIRDKQELMNEVCRIAIEFGKFRMAWIGLIDKEKQIVKPVAIDGVEEGYLSVISQISVSDVPEGRGPTGTAIRNGDHYVCANIESDQMVAPWRSEALKRGYRSSMALPLKQSGRIIGAFSLYSSQPNFFDKEEIRLLDEFVNEISFAFETIETEIEQKKAEEQIRKLSLAVEQSPASIVIANLDGTIEYANPKASLTTGYTFEELVGKNPRVLKSGETPDTEYQKLWEDITSGKEWHGIFHNKRKNGELYWESSTISPIVDNEGKITHFLAVKADITEQKLAEQEILKFRTIAEQANYGSAITSLDGKLLYINAAFARMHGYEPNELLGSGLNIFHNEEQLPKVLELLNQLKTIGSFLAQEVGHTRKDGSVFPTLMNASLIFDQNNIPQYLSATAIDITELKEQQEALRVSEEELNNAQELARLGSWEQNLVTGELKWSKNYYRMMGLEPDNVTINLYDYLRKMVHTDDLPLISFLQSHPYTRNEMQVVDIRIQLPGEGIRWIQNNVQPVFKDGRLVALRGVNIDITEKKKILEDLIKAKEQAEESDKLKTSFLNNISHEIRTPFNGILGFLSVLQYDDLSTEERDEYITLINQSAERLMNTINDIVDVSQIQSGLMKPATSVTDIQNIVSEQVSRLKQVADIKGIDFSVNYELNGSLDNFSTDGKKLSTILFHLIGNAIKFTKAGSVSLSVRGDDRKLEFCVKDTGIGISPDKQEIIFSRFRQADHSNTRKFEGSGLGLTISKSYIEMLDGYLWIESEEGKGSSFYFIIPNSNKPLEGITHPANIKLDSKRNNLKILIAEDDEGSAKYISIIVKPFGREIIKVRSGAEAVILCRDNPDIDLILMDIRMPIMDGYEATRQIRKFNSKVVIIAQTAFALSGDNQKALEVGCNDYIAKPIKDSDLKVLIKKYFN